MSRWAMVVDIEPIVDPSARDLRLQPGVKRAITGKPYRANANAEGGTPPYTYAALSGLPAWATLDPDTGEITGTPTGGVDYVPIEIEVTDADSTTTSMLVAIDVVDAISIEGVFAPAEEDMPYESGLTVTGATGSVTWGMTGTVPGLSIDTGTGIVSGTPTTAGKYAITIDVTDSIGATTQRALTFAVAPALSINTFSGGMPAGLVGAAYSFTPLVSGGVAPLTFEIVTGASVIAAAGLKFDPNTGRVTGTPTAPTFLAGNTIQIRATDLIGATSTGNYFFVVNAVPDNPVVASTQTFFGNDSDTDFAFSLGAGPWLSGEVYEVISGIAHKIDVDVTLEGADVRVDFSLPPESSQEFRIVVYSAMRPA